MGAHEFGEDHVEFSRLSLSHGIDISDCTSTLSGTSEFLRLTDILACHLLVARVHGCRCGMKEMRKFRINNVPVSKPKIQKKIWS
jgi:hypothetical protein